MWRKNMRDNGGGVYGVDLNRNYGYMWGCDDTGSSPDSTGETFRGPSAFSEPETQAVKWLSEYYNFRLALNYHTYSNLLIYPWGYNNTATPDSLVFKTFGTVLCEQYDIIDGTAMETVGYVSNGDSDDWFYGEQGTKSKTFAMTPELGVETDDFWAPFDRIIPICKENINQNLNLARLALKYARVSDASPSIISDTAGYFIFDIQRLGLDSPATFTVSVTPLGNEITGTGSSKVFTGMSLLEKITDSISYTLNSGLMSGQEIKYVLSVDNGLYVYNDTVTKYYGVPVVLLNDSGNNMSNWISTTGWNIKTGVYHSSPSSITDSPSGKYPDAYTSSVRLSNQVDITNAAYAELSFWTKWSVEKGYDYIQTEISTDNGNNWTPVCGKYTKSGNYGENYYEPLYSGYQNAWIQEKVDLSDFIGNSIKLRFVLISDPYVNYDGFYFDDLKITAVNAGSSSVTEYTDLKNIDLSAPIPNPSENYAVIYYDIPQTERNVKLYVFNSMGQKVMESDNISGKGQLQVNTLGLEAGIYFYQLRSENINSKLMKLVKK